MSTPAGTPKLVGCPPEALLERHVLSQGSPAEAELVAEHAGRCAACRAWLEEARADEQLLAEVRRAMRAERGESAAGGDSAEQGRG